MSLAAPYKASNSEITGQTVADYPVIPRPISVAGLLAGSNFLRPCAGARRAQSSREPGARHADGAEARGGSTASRARILGPAAAAGAAGSGPYLGDPLPHPDPLSP